jgi:sporulation protein YlmC with PRC-barrel domain
MSGLDGIRPLPRNQFKETSMQKLMVTALALTLLTGTAVAQTRDFAPMGSVPSQDFTVSNYYKQDVYDRSDNKIGTVDDVLIDKNGNITALMIGVGGFLGLGEKTVATKFQSVQMTKKNDKWYLVMDASKEALKKAPGHKYDRATTSWVTDRS